MPDLSPTVPLDRLAAVFEHSITWEDDIWRADPVDVEVVHAKARRKFADLLDQVTADKGAVQARILLFHGQSGAGKTHLIRALRTSAHRAGKAYFGYAQMTPDVANYADYFLRRIVASLEKPYDPDGDGETGLSRLTNGLVGDTGVISAKALTELREANFDDPALAKLVLKLADEIVASPKFADQELDINIVRALLYLQRTDPRIDQRVRQYLYGRQLTELSHSAVAALDPNVGEGRAFEIIENLGKLIWTVDRAALVVTIDQVEDLRFFDDYQERFQKAIRDLIQIANRVPSAIVLISCLGDFYERVREVLAQSYIDRIEKSGPVPLNETRSAEEARLIIAKRLQQDGDGQTGGVSDPVQFFGPAFYEEFSGLSTRRLLEHAQTKCKQQNQPNGSGASNGAKAATADSASSPGFVSALAAALGFDAFFGGDAPPAADAPPGADFRERWDRFAAQSEAEVPEDEQGQMDVVAGSLALARDEWGGAIDVSVTRLELSDDLAAVDLVLKHKAGYQSEGRIFLSNRRIQGGSFNRQLESILGAARGKSAFLLRVGELPTKAKSQAAQATRKFRESGGRIVPVPIPEIERMMTVREFHAHHRNDPGFGKWFEQAKLVSGLMSIVQLLRLDLLTRPIPNGQAAPVAVPAYANGMNGDGHATYSNGHANSAAHAEAETAATYSDAQDWSDPTAAQTPAVAAAPDADEHLPREELLDENGEGRGSILAGREINKSQRAITLNKNVLKRHAAVLGGSGSGKTTLALCVIEQLLLRGTPAILIDRKGDLCSYANPEVWRAIDNDYAERRGEREKLADSIDVAIYTPGRSSGRPISITLLPNGINELPEHEQQLLANLSAAAIGEMLHLKNSATHQKQSGTLSVALRLLGQRFSQEVTLADLINLLEDEDPELTESTQRMDPSGKIRRDLVAQLDSLRHRNASLFEGGGESLSMESLLGIGPYARADGRTRLSIVYTGFLGDNENILFWVAQFLSEALRFCQRNPNDELQAVVMFDEADLYIPANAKPATAEPLQSLLKRARSAGLGIMLATQSPGDLDYKSRDQITSWFIGRVREDTALRKLKAAFQSESGLDPAAVLPQQTVGEFHLVQEGFVRPMKAQRSLISAEQVPFDRIEQLARENRGKDEKQLRLFG